MSVPGADPRQLIRQIGRALLGAAPPDWKQIRAEYRSAGRHIEADVVVTGDDGQPYPIRPPMGVVELLGELRAVMYRPGRGTWLSGTYVLDHPSKFNAEFEPDVEPRWRRIPPPIGFQDELRRFPREDAYIPEWLRTRAGLPPISEPPPTPPAGTPLPPPASGSGPMPPFVRPGPTATPPGGHPDATNTPPGGTPMPPVVVPETAGEPPTAQPEPSGTQPGGVPLSSAEQPGTPPGGMPAAPGRQPPGL